MKSDAPTPAPRRRSRQLRLLLVALGIPLAILAGLLLFPAGQSRDNVHYGPFRVSTNEHGIVLVSFMATNTGRRPVLWTAVMNCPDPALNTWAEPAAGHQDGLLPPGKSRLLAVGFADHPKQWCAELHWWELPPLLSRWSFDLRTKLARRFSMKRPDMDKYRSRTTMTNHIRGATP